MYVKQRQTCGLDKLREVSSSPVVVLSKYRNCQAGVLSSTHPWFFRTLVPSHRWHSVRVGETAAVSRWELRSIVRTAAASAQWPSWTSSRMCSVLTSAVGCRSVVLGSGECCRMVLSGAEWCWVMWVMWVKSVVSVVLNGAECWWVLMIIVERWWVLLSDDECCWVLLSADECCWVLMSVEWCWVDVSRAEWLSGAKQCEWCWVMWVVLSDWVVLSSVVLCWVCEC